MLGFFKSLFKNEESLNPTKNWGMSRVRNLSFNFMNRSFCGVVLGEGMESLRDFGYTKDFQKFNEAFQLNYHAQGFAVEASDGKFDFVKLFLDEDELNPEDCRVASLDIGSGVTLSRRTKEREVEALFGKWTHRDQDQSEIVAWYKYKGLRIEAEYKLEGTLKALYIDNNKDDY